MVTLPGAIAEAAALFAGTSVDDLLILAVLSASSRATGRPRRWEIWAGQYAGIGVLIAVFAIGVGVWCLAGWWLVSHHRVAGILRDHGQWIVPAVYLLVSVYIFWKTGAFSHLR